MVNNTYITNNFNFYEVKGKKFEINMPQNEVKNNLSDPGNFIDQVRSSNNLKMSEDE